MKHFLLLILFIIVFATGGVFAYYYAPKSAIKTVTYTVNVDTEIPLLKESLSYGAIPALSQSDFFAKTKQSFIESKASFIEADLTEMKLRVFTEGLVVKEVTIITKGKDGLWWQTPAGLYKIETKEKKHYSSFGHVYENWNMAFQGNFFIHGWPYYKGGEPVASQFSGGCIRLSDEDAKSVYDLVTVGTPVLVYEKAFSADHFIYPVHVPVVTASSYLVADIKNNHIIASSNSTSTKQIGAISKLVTGLVAAEYINLDKDIVVRKDSQYPYQKQRLQVGESVSAYSLLFPLLLESSNEAGDAITIPLGASRFISLMNKKTKSLGMNETILFDQNGLDEKNVSTTEDLFMLAKYVYLNRNFIFHMTSETIKGSAYQSSFSGLSNKNLYKGDKAFVGGIVGNQATTSMSFLGIFDIKMKNEVRPVAIIILDSQDSKKDVDALREFVVKEYGDGDTTATRTE